MKRLLQLAILLLASMVCRAQSKTNEVVIRDKEFGKNLITNEPITGAEYDFEDRIHDSYMDTTSNTLTLYLRGVSKNGKWLNNTGKVIFYDLNSSKIKWSKSINYNQTYFEQLNSLIIETTVGKSYSLNPQNGAQQWEIRKAIYSIDPTHNIGLGYDLQTAITRFSHTLRGVNLSNGEEIWSREINREYGWNDIFGLNDSIMVVVSSGIHTVNLKNGKGWDYDTHTGRDDYTGTAVANAAGLALGVLTGTFAMTSGHSAVTGIVSNVVMDSSNFYIASRQKLSCIEVSTGKIVWSKMLPKDMTSKSTLLLGDSTVYLINRGFAYMGKRQIDYGKPFIAAFDLKNGNQKYFNPIATKEFISGFQTKGGVIFLVFKNSIMKYSLNDGNLLTLETYDRAETGDLRYFVGSQVYISKDSMYTNLALSDTTKQFMFTTTGKTLILNDELKIDGQIDLEDLFVYFEGTKDYAFLSRGAKVFILNKEQKKVAELNAGGNSMLAGKSLLEIREKSLIKIDLSEVLKE